MSGWIKIHRRLLQWEWYSDTNTVRLFLHLLLNANYEDKRWRGFEIKRGQLVTGRLKLSEETNLSQQQVRTCLERLKSTNEITIKTTNKYTVITINKYEEYQQTGQENNQEINQQDNQQITNKQPTNNQQITTTKEYKNNKKERNKESIPSIAPNETDVSDSEQKKTAKKAFQRTPINFDFSTGQWENITDADRERWKEAYPACDIKRQLTAAADWLIANPNKLKKNYNRFLANWLSNSQQKGGDIGSRRSSDSGYDRNLLKNYGGCK